MAARRPLIGRLPAFAFYVLLAGAAVPAHAAGDRVTLRIPGGTYSLLFDNRKIKVPRVEDAILVSPEAEIPGLDTVLEECRPKDPAYAPCGEDPIDYPGFVKNAKINIDRQTEKYLRIKAAKHPRELSAPRAYMLRNGAFYIWLLNTRLEFYRTEKLHVLKRKFGDVEPEKVCALVIDRISAANKRVDAFRLARVDWHNCVNAAFSERYSKYPRQDWDKFLRKYGLKEKTETTRK